MCGGVLARGEGDARAVPVCDASFGHAYGKAAITDVVRALEQFAAREFQRRVLKGRLGFEVDPDRRASD